LPSGVHSRVACRELACSPQTGLPGLRGGLPPPNEPDRDAGLRVHLWFQVLLI
jgi:hypothetical protein